MISIVIAAYNEADAIALTIDEINRTLQLSYDSDRYEIIVVDDGSIDNTAEFAAKAGAEIIRHPHNLGYGYALKTGIAAAKFDTIIIIDADLTYPASAIPALIDEYISSSMDMVVGARTGHLYEGGPLKGPLRILLKILVEFTAGRKVPDANSGLRVFNKTTVSCYVEHLCNTFSFTTTLTLAYMLTGRFVNFIPVDYRNRIGSSKVLLIRDTLRTLQYIFQAINYYNPIKIYLVLAFITLFSGILSAIITVLYCVPTSVLIIFISIISSIILLAFGLVADLLRQIMNKHG